MKTLLLFSILLFSYSIFAQDETLVSDSEAAQIELNEEFSNPETTILEPADFKNFKGLEFYPFDEKFIVKANLVLTPNEKPFLMPTTTSRTPEYVKYGEAHFSLEGKDFVLNIFKSTEPYDEPGYEDYLFLPFTDLTSGDGSYGGGRFLDQRIPEDDTLVIDFNKAYNPYCAYSPRFSCPIPPKENDLLIRIEAGVKDFGKH
ncbi:Protein of unknown function (DUF1684) [Aequorivita sublithincola DSM 14238]|uniref:DUF1684 domain-containing protein n=1 Tax=Aequorivita sublithincola (strain DSM 14238 / LMG 21431 / ACAM 643 / 9-3) TaxID=746697 RepID=I3YSD0_AEQSU|nr:DUF1684 domain-containing protein [Aequorivita sublithincola]AFL79898.1 Protein of unknown function (DUF1684) [Aequorivita sublithincola DSM 14238]